MCEEKREAKTKAERLIEAMDRLTAALMENGVSLRRPRPVSQK